MSYEDLMKKYPRLADKFEAVQTLSNMGLVEVDNFRLETMMFRSSSNRFIRTTEKWLQENIETALEGTEYNLVITNLSLIGGTTSPTNMLTNLIGGTRRVLQFSKHGFAVLVDNPVELSKKLNNTKHFGCPIRAYAINTRPRSMLSSFFVRLFEAF